MNKKFVIDTFSKFFFGSDVWGQVQGIIKIVEDTELSGSDKRQLALVKLNKLGISLVGFLLNLALELAVAKLKL